MARKFTPKPLEWPRPKIYYEVGDRVEYRLAYAGGRASEDAPYDGLRGTVVKDAPLSIMSGVEVRWDDGTEMVVSGLQARKLGLLELIAEL